jgi:hypothetical protein
MGAGGGPVARREDSRHKLTRTQLIKRGNLGGEQQGTLETNRECIDLFPTSKQYRKLLKNLVAMPFQSFVGHYCPPGSGSRSETLVPIIFFKKITFSISP